MSHLARWSRRKRGEVPDAPASEGDHEASRVHEPSTTTADDEREESATSAPPPAPGSLDDTLPDPDTLPPGSDIQAFLAPGVSAGLRRRALRRLFAAKHYNLRDGLDDYDDDYRQRLKPLADEVAQRLRRWAEPAEESMTEDDSQTASVDDPTGKHANRDTSPAPSPAQERVSRDASDENPPVTDAGNRGEEPDTPGKAHRGLPGPDAAKHGIR